MYTTKNCSRGDSFNLLFGYDVIHGFKTIFPINLGIASSWDLNDVEEVARISAEEASASGCTDICSND